MDSILLEFDIDVDLNVKGLMKNRIDKFLYNVAKDFENNAVAEVPVLSGRLRDSLFAEHYNNIIELTTDTRYGNVVEDRTGFAKSARSRTMNRLDKLLAST